MGFDPKKYGAVEVKEEKAFDPAKYGAKEIPQKKSDGGNVGGSPGGTGGAAQKSNSLFGALAGFAINGAKFVNAHPEEARALTQMGDWEQAMRDKQDADGKAVLLDDAEKAAMGDDSFAGRFINKITGGSQNKATSNIPEQQRLAKYQQELSDATLSVQSKKIAPAIQTLASVVAKRPGFWKDGVVDYEKVYKTAGELSKQLGGGDNAKEAIAPVLVQSIQDEARRPRLEKTFDATLKSKYGYGIDELSKKELTAEQKAQVEADFQTAYKQVLDDEAKAMTKTNDALRKMPGAGGVLMGAAFLSGINNTPARIGSGLASMGINNSVTDWLRGRKNAAEYYDIPDRELTLKNILTDPAGTVGTRGARQVGQMLPMLAVAAVVRNPRLAASYGLTDDTVQQMGEMHEKTMQETGDPLKAQKAVVETFKSQMQLSPTYFLQFKFIDDILKGKGSIAKGIATGAAETGMENVQELVQEHQSSGKSWERFFKDGDAWNVIKETTVANAATMGLMGSYGKAYQQITKASPEAMQQHLANIMQRDGWLGASKHLNALFENGDITATEFNKLLTDGKKISQGLKTMKEMGVEGKQALAATSLTLQIDELQAKHDKATSAPLKKVLKKQINEKQAALQTVMDGRGGYVHVTVADGSSFTVPKEQAGKVMQELKEEAKNGVVTVEVVPEVKEEGKVKAKDEAEQEKQKAAIDEWRSNNPEYADMTDEEISFVMEGQKATSDAGASNGSEPVTKGDGLSTAPAPATEATTDDGRQTTDSGVAAAVAEPVQQDAAAAEEQGIAPAVQQGAELAGQPETAGAVAVVEPVAEDVARGTEEEVEADPTPEETQRIVDERNKKQKLSPRDIAINKLLDLNRRLQAMTGKGGKVGKLSKEEIQEQDRLKNQIRLGVNDLGLKFDGVNILAPAKDPKKPWRKVSATYKDSSNLAIDPDGGTIKQRGEKTQSIWKKLRNDAFIKGLDIKGADGNKMSEDELLRAIEDVRMHVPSHGATALMNAMDEMADTGMVAMKVDGNRFGVPVDEYFAEVETVAAENEAGNFDIDEVNSILQNDSLEQNDEHGGLQEDSGEPGSSQPAVRGNTDGPAGSESEAGGSEAGAKEVVDEEADFDSGFDPDKLFQSGTDASPVADSDPRFKNVVSAISRMFAKVKGFGGVVVLKGDAFADAVESATGEKYHKSNGTVYGFVRDGRIYLNGDAVNLNTPVHEAAHLFTNWLKANNPELHKAGLAKMKGTAYETLIRSRPFYQQQIAKMKAAGKSQEEIDAWLADEALATAVGDSGARMLDNQKKGFRQWLNDMWAAVKDFFGKGLENKSAREVEKMHFGQFADAVAKRILSGRELKDRKGRGRGRGQGQGQEAKFHIVGEKGAAGLSDAWQSFKKAKEMEKAGMDDAAIWAATGWEKAADGKWTYEIPDVKFKNADKTIADITDVASGKKAYLSKPASEILDGDLLKAYPEFEDVLIEFVNEPWNDNTAEYNPSIQTDDGTKRRILVNVNGDRIAAYGEKRNVLRPEDVEAIRNMPGADAGEQGRIRELFKYLVSRLVVHETQHFIQEKERFAKGSNVEEGKRMVQDAFNEDLYKTDPKYKQLADEAAALDGDFFNYDGAEKFFAASQRAEAYAKEALRKHLKEKGQTLSDAGHEMYERHAGEVQSRNAEKRHGMSAEERRATPMSETEDRGRDQQIIKPQDGSASEASVKLSPEKAYEKAVKELRAAEDKIAQQQAQQTDMFAGGTQQDMFGGAMNREEVQAYLKPYRDRVAQAKEAMDKAGNKQEADGRQITMFHAGDPNATPAGDRLTQKLVADAQRQLSAGKTIEQVVAKIQKETFLPEEQARAIVNSAMNKLATPVFTTQQPAFDTNELRETIVNFGKEMRAKFKQGWREGGADAANTFKRYEQTRDRIRSMVTDMLRTAQKLKLVKGDLPANVWPGIIRRLSRAKTTAGLLSFYDYFKQVLQDVHYETKLTEAKAFQSKIKKAAGSKAISRNAVSTEAYKAFGRLDPAKVSNIDEYNQIAARIQEAAVGIKARATTTNPATVSNESLNISNEEINEYLQQQYDHLAQKAADRMAEQYKDLVDDGIIDPMTMSAAEIKEIVDAIHGEDENALQRAAEMFANNEKKLEALRNAVDYNRMGLADVDNPDLTDEQKKVVEDLRRLDMDKLTAKQLAKLNDAINNIIVNGDFHGAGEISRLADVQDNIAEAKQQVEDAGVDLGDIDNMFIRNFTSTQLMNQFIFKLNKLSANIQRLVGIHGIMSGHARAKNLQDRTVAEYQRMKKGLKDIDSAINRIRRGIYADVFNNFGGTNEEVAAEFDRRKNLIKQTYEALLFSSDPKEVQEGKVIEQAYNELLADSPDILAVTAKMDAINPKNIELVQFWQKAFDGQKARVQERAELYSNKIWEDVENYTATKYKGVNGRPDPGKQDQIDNFDKEFIARGLAHEAAGSTNKKSRNQNLPHGSVLNLDFDNVQSRVFYETNYDVETSQAINQFKLFMRSPEAKEIFGSEKNRKIVFESMRATVLQQKGKTPQLDAANKFAEDFEKHVLRKLQAKGVRIALGSVSQFLKQYPSVAVNTLASLGKDAGLYAKALMVSNKIPLFDRYAIGLRGDTKAGYNRDVDLGEIDKADFGGDIGRAMNKAGEIGEKIAEGTMAALVRSDVSVARTSWLAYYMSDLKRQGVDIDQVDWASEHENPNDEAAAYAEQMVSRTQNPNDASALPAAFKARGAAKLLSRLFMPFSTFSTNMRGRFFNDIQKLRSGNKQAIKEGMTSLAATAAEQMLFNAIKVYLIQAATGALVKWVAGEFDFWDDDDEAREANYKNPEMNVLGAEYKNNDKAEKVVANTMSDLFFSGMGAGTQSFANQLMNVGWGAMADEQYADGKTNKHPQLFYQAKDQQAKLINPETFGIYGIALQKLGSAIDMKDEVFGKTDMYIKNPDKNDVQKTIAEKVDINANEAAIYRMMFLIDALALMGVGDAEITQANSKLKRLVDKRMENIEPNSKGSGGYGGMDTMLKDRAAKK